MFSDSFNNFSILHNALNNSLYIFRFMFFTKYFSLSFKKQTSSQLQYLSRHIFLHMVLLFIKQSLVKRCFCRISEYISKIQNCACSYHVTYTFWSESTLYSCLIVRELLASHLAKPAIFAE